MPSQTSRPSAKIRSALQRVRSVQFLTFYLNDHFFLHLNTFIISFWRMMVTPERIENYERQYRYSDLEKADLKRAYLKSEGNMDHILSSVCLSKADDEQRFARIIKAWIKSGEVPDFEKFSKETQESKDRRKRAAEAEAAEAEEIAKAQLAIKNAKIIKER